MMFIKCKLTSFCTNGMNQFKIRKSANRINYKMFTQQLLLLD